MIIALTVIGYLIGSIPVAWIVAKLVTGQDLRQMGSGNVGVMNTALSVARLSSWRADRRRPPAGRRSPS